MSTAIRSTAGTSDPPSIIQMARVIGIALLRCLVVLVLILTALLVALLPFGTSVPAPIWMLLAVADLPQHFSPHLPRGWIAGVLFAVGGFLLLAWVGRIVPPLLQNQTPALENTTTLVIQTMDLALIVPLAVLSGILLLRRSAWGYLLASVFVMKAITMGLGVSSMAINMALVGVPDSLLITLMNLVMAVLLLKNVEVGTKVPQPAV